jgi:hypothetical protein
MQISAMLGGCLLTRSQLTIVKDKASMGDADDYSKWWTPTLCG